MEGQKEKDKTLLKRILEKFENHPLVVILCLVVIVAGGLNTIGDFIQKIWSPIKGIYVKITPTPIVPIQTPISQTSTLKQAATPAYSSQKPVSTPTAIPISSIVPSKDNLSLSENVFQGISGIKVKGSNGKITIIINNQNLFDFDSYDLTSEAKHTLEQVTDILIQYPQIHILIAGYTDSSGSSDYNQRLSKYRAQSVASYLSKKGLQANQLRIIGYGEENPLASNSTEEGRQRNRRIELEIQTNQ